MNRLCICLLTAALVFVAACGAKDEPNSSQPSANANTGNAEAGAQGRSLDEEMARLNVSTALVIPSGQIVHLPVWSPESDQLATRVGSRWYRVNLKQVVLNPFDWKTEKAGRVTAKESVALAPSVEIQRWQKVQAASQENRRAVTTRNGLKLELRKEGANTSFIATKVGQNPRVVWSVEENCEGLMLSPDEKYVAFLGEDSGMFVVNLGSL